MISPYHRENVISHKKEVDFYDLLRLLESNGKTIPHEVVHAIKKLCFVNGGRGHKSILQDLKESVGSINRYLEFLEEVDYNPQDLSEEEIEQVIEEHEDEVTHEAFSLFEPNYHCYTRSGEHVSVDKGRLQADNKYSVFHIGTGLSLCMVDATTYRVNTATDIDSPHDLMYNELPEFFKEEK